MTRVFKDWKVLIGLAIAAFCLFLAFRKVDFEQMWMAFKQMDYWFLLPTLAIMFLSHWLRALRWRFFLAPIHKVCMKTLYSSLLIGYMANTFLPAHLGEFIRAYLVSKRYPIPGSSVFATIVIERIIDVFTLLTLMAVTIIVFPFPKWVQQSGYISFAFIAVLFVALLLMKKHRSRATKILDVVLKPLPSHIGLKISELLHSFLDGVVGLKNWRHYIAVGFLSIAIWFCYGYIFQIGLHAFNFVETYNTPWMTPLVLLVITTIAVLVPSSPGYVGTYHYLCQISLGFFGVPESDALTFAFVIHGINFLPILIVGLILVAVMGMNLKNIRAEATREAHEIDEELENVAKDQISTA